MRVQRRLAQLFAGQTPALDLIDVGARGGIPAKWKPLAAHINVVAVEPDAEEAARLSGDVIPYALADVAGEREFFLTVSGGLSSLLPPNASFFNQFPEAGRANVTRRVRMRTQTLDGSGRTAPAFVKIDVQGAEGLVLLGAHETLRRNVAGVEVEVGFAPLYEGQSQFGDVHRMLSDAGLELVDLRHTYWRRAIARDIRRTRGQIAFADALYMISPATLRERPHLATAAALTCVVYGLNEWIVAYGEALPQHGLLKDATAIVRQWSARGFPNFRGRERLGLWLQDLGDAVLEARSVWGKAEIRLGNRPRLG